MKLIIYRKKKFASALVPYFIILSDSKGEFLNKYKLSNDNACKLDWSGHAVQRTDFDPVEYSIPIKNGETLELDVPENANSIFAMTTAGLLSNEIVFDKSLETVKIVISTKGGLGNPSYPVLSKEN